jgi:hypothetical protein
MLASAGTLQLSSEQAHILSCNLEDKLSLKDSALAQNNYDNAALPLFSPQLML